MASFALRAARTRAGLASASTSTSFPHILAGVTRTNTPAAAVVSDGILTRTAACAPPTHHRCLSTSSRALASAQEQKDPQLGDYPDLPAHSLQLRKWSPTWWDPQEKRNFGETLHEQDDVLSVWAPDVHALPAYSALRQFLVAALVASGFAAFMYATYPDAPAERRAYPREGLAEELGGRGAVRAAEGEAGEGEEEEEDDDE